MKAVPGSKHFLTMISGANANQPQLRLAPTISGMDRQFIPAFNADPAIKR